MGFDVGGTKVEMAVLGADGTVIQRRRESTPREYLDLVALLRTMAFDAERELGTECTVGVGAPGSPNPATGVHRNSNHTCMNGRPFAADLAAALGRPVPVSNDGNCLALSEAMNGAARGARVVFGVVLGTGVGGGVVVDGRVLDGANGVAGEWGHNAMPGVTDAARAAATCYCGRLGCVEQFLSGGALQRRFGEAAGQDAAALAWYSAQLAHALSQVVNILDPDVIVLAGGLSNIPDLPARVQEHLPLHVFSDACNTRVVRAQHGDASGVLGAAWLGRQGTA
ncbi:MAG: ROK family protein [Phycisphaerales bacterium]